MRLLVITAHPDDFIYGVVDRPAFDAVRFVPGEHDVVKVGRRVDV
jgi:hypothetical protein